MTNTNNQLQSIVERIEKLEAEKADIADLIKDIYVEAKANGFDAKILRKVVALRKKNALGMLADTPLGKAAISREFE